MVRTFKQLHSRGQEGVALILGILFTIVVVGIVVSGTILLKSHRQLIEMTQQAKKKKEAATLQDLEALEQLP